MIATSCHLCGAGGGRLLWQGDLCRVVAVDDPAIPGFMRVILSRHVAEMTDLSAEGQRELLRVVLIVEAIVRRYLQPDKVNLASLGNVVPHLHWHVIPRWRDDAWFPDPIWAPARRPAAVPEPRRAAAEAMSAQFEREMAAALAGTTGA